MPSGATRLQTGVARAFLFAACLAGSSCASAHQARFAPLGAQHSHRVPFEIGHAEAADGNAIAVEEVWGTRPVIEVGGSYIVKGTYKLAAADAGELAFWETAKGWNNSGPNLDTQIMRVRQGEGEFMLLHTMAGPGYFHLVLQAGWGRERTTVADVYFGHGETLLKKNDASGNESGDIIVLTHSPGDHLDGFNALNNVSLGDALAKPEAAGTRREEIARLKEQIARLLEGIRVLEERVRALEKSGRDG